MKKPVRGKLSPFGWPRRQWTTREEYPRKYLIHILAMKRFNLFKHEVWMDSHFHKRIGIVKTAAEEMAHCVHVTATCSTPVPVIDELTLIEKSVALAHDEWKKPPLDIGVERY